MEKLAPNLVFVFCDQFRKQTLEFMNEDLVYTPSLNSFARESKVLTHAVSNRPLCSPYRGMLFTGKYPFSNGILDNCHSGHNHYNNYLKKDEICISDILKENGYYNGYIGKWHLDPPQKKNFQYTEGRRKEGYVWDSFTSIEPETWF